MRVWQLDDLVAPGEAAAIRARLERAAPRERWIADRGRYLLDEAHREPALFATVHAAAVRATGLRLDEEPAAFAWTVLRHGDYSLVKDDALRWAAAGAHLDATLDLSAAALPGEAELVYGTGAGALPTVIEQRPGRLALVDRRAPGVARYERYLNHRAGDRRVVRLRLFLRLG